MYRFIVGIDVSKEWVDASWTDGPSAHYLGRYSNSIVGFKKLIVACKKETSVDLAEWFICFENTGTYSKFLLQWLCSQQIPCREENPIRLSKEAGLRRGKSDKLDSAVICQFAYKNRDRIQQTLLSSPAIHLMKKLLSRRNFLVRQKAARLTSLKEQKAEFPPALFKILSAQDKAAIQKLTEDIEFVEKQIKQIIASDHQMVRNDRLAQSVCGIGPITTWYMLAFTNNFNNFKKARQFACYSGIAPFPNESGSSRQFKRRVNPMANKTIKAVLSNGAVSAITYDTEIRNYYHRKVAEGKEPGVVMNAVKNKLVSRVFAVVNRGTPFVSTHNYA